MRQRQTGFTLIELMITVAIAALVVTVALPGFNEFIARGVRTSQVNNFVSALKLARSEAVTAATRVTLCKSADGQTCNTGALGYEQGWIVFRDRNRTAQVANPADIVRVYGALPAGWTLTPNATAPADRRHFIFYESSGTSQLMQPVTFTLQRSGNHPCGIIVDSVGRPKLAGNCDQW